MRSSTFIRTEILKKLNKVGKPLKAILPVNFDPQLAFLSHQIPTDNNWIHEVKFDGYRLITRIDQQRTQCFTRNKLDWSRKVPVLIEELNCFPVKQTLLDGELVVLDKKGISRFQLLQNSLKNHSSNVVYFIFDIPYCDGFNLKQCTLELRKAILSDIFKKWKKSHPHILLSHPIQGKGASLYQVACQKGLEGIISKRLDSHYVNKRSRTWLKNKCINRQEFVIGGYTQPQGTRQYFGSLLIGYYSGKKLIYCGHVGTGFNQKTLKSLHHLLATTLQGKSPFCNTQDIPKVKQVTWVKPKQVCEVTFTEWTTDNLLRHPVFIGLRIDIPASKIRKE